MGLLGLTLTGTTISATNNNTSPSQVTLPVATQDVSGIVSAGTQTFSGDKTFNGIVSFTGQPFFFALTTSTIMMQTAFLCINLYKSRWICSKWR